MRVLVAARQSMATDRTRSVNALTALLRSFDLGMDARKAIVSTQIDEISRWRSREEPLALSTARSEAVRLARRINELDADIKSNSRQITDLIEISEAAPLLRENGIGPVTAAVCLTAWSGLTMVVYVRRRRLPPWRASTRYRHHQVTQSDTGSTGVVTEA